MKIMSCISRCGAIESPPTTSRSPPSTSPPTTTKRQGNEIRVAEEVATELGLGYVFDGFVVTSIDYKRIGTTERPNLIEFSESTPGNEEEQYWIPARRKKHNKELVDAATFLKNVTYVDGKDKDGSRRYEAESLTIEKAEEEFVEKYKNKHGEDADIKPFFSVFGYSGEAGYILNTCTKAQENFDRPYNNCEVKNVIIPVIWPSAGNMLWYLEDRDENAPEAAKELSMLVQGTLENANVFKSKNLLCHSMGNRIFRMAADAKVKFDNIFMAAADIRHDIFREEYISRATNEESVEMEGMHIFKMLEKGEDDKPKGKIYCLYNPYDVPLGAVSPIANNGLHRLGTTGIGAYDPNSLTQFVWPIDEEKFIHPEIHGHTENFDATDELPTQGEHSYSNMWFAIKYYRRSIEKTGNHS